MNTNILKNKSNFFILIRFYYIIVLLIVFQCKICPQQKCYDDLELKASVTQVSKEKVEALNELAWLYKCNDADKAYDYAKQAYEYTRKMDNNAWAAISYVNIAYVYIVSKEDFDGAMICFKKSYKITKNIKYTSEAKSVLAKIFDGLGLINYKLGEYDIAINCYNQALALFLQEAQYYNASNCYHNLAIIYERIGDMKKADLYFKREVTNNSKINKYYTRKSLKYQSSLSMVVSLEDINYVKQ